jgi:hypothetical protein
MRSGSAAQPGNGGCATLLSTSNGLSVTIE